LAKISIKGNLRDGIKIEVDPSLTWLEIKEEIEKELEKRQDFLKGISMNVDLKDRRIDEEEWYNFQQEIFKKFGIMLYRDIFNTKIVEKNLAEIIIGPVRNGRKIFSRENILILGDVNPGAEVVSEKSIYIIGKLKGSVYAGFEDNRKALIFCLDLDPIHLQIADLIWNKEKIKEKGIGYWTYIENEKIKISLYLV